MYMLRDGLSRMSNDDVIDAVSDMMENPEMISPIPQNPTLEGDLKRYQFKDLFL